MELSDRVAIITGAKRIGAVVAEALARRGVDVSLSFNRSKGDAEQAASAVRATGRRAVVTQANVALADDCRRLVEHTVAELGRLDIVINMASTYRKKPFDQMTDADWDQALAVDLTGAYRCARAAVPHLRRANGGHIINFSDWVAASGRPRYRGYLPYYVAKRAVVGLTEGLALELASDRILVNAIAPGPIMPPDTLDAHEAEEVERATPLARWGGADEIAKAIVGLLDSDFITGETIRVDGGRHLR